MKQIYITVTGTRYYHGKEFLESGMMLELVKEPENEFDKEAIVVRLPGLGDIGHVANSPNTVVGESMSAGRLYDKMGDTAMAKVLYVLPTGVLSQVESGDIHWERQEEA